MSGSYRAELAEMPLVLMVAATSSGRNTIMRELVKIGDYYYVPSDTTRPKRYNDGVLEQDGVEYFFRTEDEFLSDLQKGVYIEAAIIHDQQVSGMNAQHMKRAFQSGKIPITDCEVMGSDVILNAIPKARAIFVVPPSFEEWIKRFYNRGAMNKIEVRRRLVSAIAEFDVALNDQRFSFVINDNLQEAVHDADIISKGGSLGGQYNKQAKKLIRELRDRSEKFIKALDAQDF